MSDFELLAHGYRTVEGPTVDVDGGLYFSDVHGGGVYRLSPDGAVEIIVPKRKGVGGLCLHADGGIVVSGRDLSHVKDGATRTIMNPALLAPSGGGQATGFNDLVCDRRGRLFTGTVKLNADGDRVPGEGIMITGVDAAQVIYDDVPNPNGIAFSADEAELYHVDTFRRRVIVSQFDSTGAPYRVRDIPTTAFEGLPDGLVTDSEGCLWIAFLHAGFVGRMSPDGENLGELRVPSQDVTSLCFGGPDMTDLYVVSADHTEHPELGGCIFRVATDVRGSRVASCRIG